MLHLILGDEPVRRRPHALRSARGPAAMLGAALILAASPAAAQPLTLTYRGFLPIGATTTDQNGQAFTITGLSGVRRTGAGTFQAVMDNSSRLVNLSIGVGQDGSLQSVSVVSGFTLGESRDFEGAAPWRSDNVILSEEGTPAVHAYSLATGARLLTFPTPSVFSNRRSNRGFESLARSPDATHVWTANEEALTVDGQPATQSQGTVVRLLRFDIDASGTPAAGAQHAYAVDPLHGAPTFGSVSGLVDLVALPDGRLLALERSLALGQQLFQSRVYEVSLAGATDVRSLPGLIGQTYTPVTKRLLWSGSVENLEGLCLGARLEKDRFSVIGIVDDADPISSNKVIAFELAGLTPLADGPATPAPSK